MEKLASYLTASNMTQAEFAKAISVSQPTVHRWIAGKDRPTWATAALIEKITGGIVPVSAWAEITQSKSPSDPAPENAEAR